MCGKEVVAIAVFGFLFLDGKRKREQEEAERAERLAAFPDALWRELRSVGLENFDLWDLAERCGVHSEDASEAAGAIYERILAPILDDLVISEAERRKLDAYAHALCIEPAEVDEIEKRARLFLYQTALNEAAYDGVLTQDELNSLKRLQSKLNLSSKEVRDATEEQRIELYGDQIRRVVLDDPPLSEAIKRRLKDLRTQMHLDQSGSSKGCIELFNSIYRECVSSILSDGIVTDEEEAKLYWLATEGPVEQAIVAESRSVVARAKEFGNIRNGRFPVVASSALLNGGETCHWRGACRYRVVTPSGKLVDHSGELIVTSNRVVFTGPSKSFEFGFTKVVDVERETGNSALHLRLSKSGGTGTYFVEDAEMVENLLVGLSKKHKYTLASRFSSELTRHIPKDVKHEVWVRDGGRCVTCHANTYLEFDHIIPHSRGGANTVGNVQLLCRKCNLEKRDRI